MMLLGSLVNMLAIFAGCFVGVTLGRFIPERFNSAIEKGIALCVFYIGLDGVLAGSDTLVAILSMVLGVILGELLDLDGRIHALGDWVERRFAKKQSKTSISEGFVNASLLFCVGAMAIMGALTPASPATTRRSTPSPRSTASPPSSTARPWARASRSRALRCFSIRGSSRSVRRSSRRFSVMSSSRR